MTLKANFDLLKDESFLKYTPLYIITLLSRDASLALLDQSKSDSEIEIGRKGGELD